MFAVTSTFIFACLSISSHAAVMSGNETSEVRQLKQKALASFLFVGNPALAGARRHAVSMNHAHTGARQHMGIAHPYIRSKASRLAVDKLSMPDRVGMDSPTSSFDGSDIKEPGMPLPLAIFLSDGCVQHDMGPDHPERPERLSHLIGLARGAWSHEFGEQLRIHESQADVTFDQLLGVHTPEYLMRIKTAFEEALHGKPVALDSGDTVVHPGTPLAALRAAGLVVAAVDEILGPSPAHNRAFVLARPPGHHAEPARAMGFCFFNNVMVGVAHAEKAYGVKRIAILDFDVHHGNGDEAMTSTSGTSRLYASSHQAPLWPGTGTGKQQADENNHIINVPLPAGAGSTEFRDAWRNEILPAVKDFAPEMVFLSAGFDAHADDPLASLQLSAIDFQWITYAILEAVNVPVVSVLEGGYDINSLGESAHAHVEALVKAPATQSRKHLINSPHDSQQNSQPTKRNLVVEPQESTTQKPQPWFVKKQSNNHIIVSRQPPSDFPNQVISSSNEQTSRDPTKQPWHQRRKPTRYPSATQPNNVASSPAQQQLSSLLNHGINTGTTTHSIKQPWYAKNATKLPIKHHSASPPNSHVLHAWWMDASPAGRFNKRYKGVKGKKELSKA